MQTHPILFLALLAGGFAIADTPHRQHGPHVHGEATLDIAMDGAQLFVSLEAPGMSMLGFEHPPRDEAERAAYTRALAALESPGGWLSLPDAAACRLDSHEVKSHGLGAKIGDDAAASGEHAGHEHADFDADYRYTCHAPLALHDLQVRLFDLFDDLHKINVELVLPGRQGSQVLTRGSTRVPFSK